MGLRALIVALLVVSVVAVDEHHLRRRHRHRHLRQSQSTVALSGKCPAGYNTADVQIADATFTYPLRVPRKNKAWPQLPTGPCGELVANVHDTLTKLCAADKTGKCTKLNTMLGVGITSAKHLIGANSGPVREIVTEAFGAHNIPLAGQLNGGHKLLLIKQALAYWKDKSEHSSAPVAWKLWDDKAGSRDMTFHAMETAASDGSLEYAMSLNDDGKGGARVFTNAYKTTPIGTCAGQKLMIAAGGDLICMAEIWFEAGASLDNGAGVSIENSAGGTTVFKNGQLVPSCFNCQVVLQPFVKRDLA